MLKTIEIISANGNEDNISKLFKKYVIDFLKTNDIVQSFPQYQDSDWQWLSHYSPLEFIDQISWEWNTRIAPLGQDGASGECIIYFKSNEQIRSTTSEKIIKDGEVYTVEIRVTS